MKGARSGNTKCLMVQGTGSHVGKSLLVAALCRIFSNKGVSVAPFKAQNMALNSAVTMDGGEVGRSTAVQARAARTALRVEMNPVLLKPKSDRVAQMILLGKPYADFSAREQFGERSSLKETKLRAIRESLAALSGSFETIVIEGAGSPAEVNLREWDVVNMAVAEIADAPVLLIADIDRGGAIAALFGTWSLLPEEERRRIKGFVINKFRGDPRLLAPALRFLEEKTGIPTAGVIPYDSDLSLMEEDALPSRAIGCGDPEIEIAVVEHRHLSNFTDFDPLAVEPGVIVRYVRTPAQLGSPDAIILPGTKNTIDDLRIHLASGMAASIRKRAGEGVPVVGICGGYQMLGKALLDPDHLESNHGDVEGLNLLEVVTEFRPGKVVGPVDVTPAGRGPFLRGALPAAHGYEIHSGETRRLYAAVPPAFLKRGGEGEGAVDPSGLIFGTSVHGFFEEDSFRRHFVNVLRVRKALLPLSVPAVRFAEMQEREFDRWAGLVEKSLDWAGIEKMMQRPG